MMMKIKKRSRKNTIALTVVCAVILSLGAFAYYVYLQNQNGSQQEPETSSSANQNSDDSNTARDPKVNANTSDDKQNNDQGDDSHTATQKKSVSVVLVDSSRYGSVFEIRSYVPDAIENDGVCKFTFVNSKGLSFSHQTTATPSASSTACGTLDVPVSEFNGDESWKFNVQYTSSTSAGSLPDKSISLK